MFCNHEKGRECGYMRIQVLMMMQQRTKYHEHHRRINMLKKVWINFLGDDLIKIKHH